jgi:glucokinase
MSKYVIGVDLGGTNMRVGLITDKGEVVDKDGTSTNMETASGEDILKRMADLIYEIIKKTGVSSNDIMGAGIGIPGPLDPKIGGAHPPNLTQLSGLRIVDILEEATGLKVMLENDANAAAWGEYWIGAGKGCKSMLQVTLGTGVGGGLILDGKMVRGIDWTAGELGHVVIVDGGRKCACGSNGCIEAYASANSTVRRFNELLESGKTSSLSSVDKADVTCEKIFNAAKEGDGAALSVVNETGRLLGVLAASMANLLNPEMFVVSGGMIHAGDILFDAIKKECKERAFPIPGERMKIVPAKLAGDAGLIGAAGCALSTFGISQ